MAAMSLALVAGAVLAAAPDRRVSRAWAATALIGYGTCVLLMILVLIVPPLQGRNINALLNEAQPQFIGGLLLLIAMVLVAVGLTSSSSRSVCGALAVVLTVLSVVLTTTIAAGEQMNQPDGAREYVAIYTIALKSSLIFLSGGGILAVGAVELALRRSTAAASLSPSTPPATA